MSAWIITPEPHAHPHNIGGGGGESTVFQMNPMENVEGVAETR